jgi:2-oxo-3-hexenedioate decarboxylase
MDEATVRAIADRLIAAQDAATTLEPIAAAMREFDVAAAYDVLREIEIRREAQGWRPMGRKIGFTNRTIWPRYGVWQPMAARVWSHTVTYATNDAARLSLDGFVQPRIEPEVVFGLAAPVVAGSDTRAVLAATQWIAPGFEIVQSHFPGWKFAAPDCTAAFGLHAALVVGTSLPLTAANRDAIEALMPVFRVTLRKSREIVDTGVGANVLGGPALALAHLANVLAQYPKLAPLAAGEIVTTGTITDAWPVARGETWTSDYGELPLRGLELSFEGA